MFPSIFVSTDFKLFVLKYYLFLDESGDHGLRNIDPGFPVFVLCGVLISENEYKQLDTKVNILKEEIWKDKKVILHSRDIRKCEKEFTVLFDLDIKKKFYDGINEIVDGTDYKIIAAGIKKEKFIKKYGKLKDDVYEVSLSFIIERAVFYLDSTGNASGLDIIIERRGKKEDNKLANHIGLLKDIGTYYVKPDRIKHYGFKAYFYHKWKNINGLQLSDLLAYPISRHIIDPERANPAFDVLEDKFYSKNGKKYGLKVFP